MLRESLVPYIGFRNAEGQPRGEKFIRDRRHPAFLKCIDCSDIDALERLSMLVEMNV